MKKSLFTLLFGVFALCFFSCEKEISTKNLDANIEKSKNSKANHFLVANRGSGTVSIFNDPEQDPIVELSLPGEGAQPTYLAYSNKNKSFYVGDFANSKVYYYDSKKFSLQGEIEIEQGAFHMWINDKIAQLWVNNIVSKTSSVIDLNSNEVIMTLGLPTTEIPSLTENAVQHDVVLSDDGSSAFVTVLDGPDKSYIVMYDTKSLQYQNHIEVGGDAHLLPVGKNLFIPTQNANEIVVASISDLSIIKRIPYPSAHGITASNKYVFVTGISDNKIGVIDSKKLGLVSEITTEFNVPHNVAVSNNGKKLFLAHSGGSATKSVFYNVSAQGALEKISDYDTGLNPFGVLNY